MAPATAKEDEMHPVIVDMRGLTFTYPGDQRPMVRDVSLTLRKGRTLCVLGCNECGKTTLAKLLLGKEKPKEGTITFGAAAAAAAPAAAAESAGCSPGSEKREESPGLPWAMPAQQALAGACISAAALGAVQPGIASVQALALAALLAVAIFAIAILDRAQRKVPRAAAPRAPRPSMAFITSEDAPGTALPQSRTLEDLIAEKMPAGTEPKERRRRTLAYLHEARFQMYNDQGTAWGSPEEYLRKKVTAGQLSGGQKHLIYILRQLASRPEVIVCDELLAGLDLVRKAHTVRLLRKQQAEDGAAVLYLTVDFASAHVVAHELAFMKVGAIAEGPGATTRMLDYPKDADFKRYVAEARRQEEMARGQHLRAEVARIERDE